MPGGDVALGDGKEAGKPRLGGQQVIAVGVARVGRDRKADGQQLLFGVEQEGEVHLHGQIAGQPLDFGKALVGVARRVLDMPRDTVARRAAPEGQI